MASGNPDQKKDKPQPLFLGELVALKGFYFIWFWILNFEISNSIKSSKVRNNNLFCSNYLYFNVIWSTICFELFHQLSNFNIKLQNFNMKLQTFHMKLQTFHMKLQTFHMKSQNFYMKSQNFNMKSQNFLMKSQNFNMNLQNFTKCMNYFSINFQIIF